ncbi:MAG: PIN domain-containing protein, partial [Candidatus Nanohaloarchaea archaeon]|nr:PIN domain-containing protein [Candidatus Nanohaloarchaea archaeon]
LSDKYRREGLTEEWKIRRHFVRMKSEVLDLDFSVAEEAGDLKQELRKEHEDAGLADAVILSHAHEEEATVLTGDRHLVHREAAEDISNR